MSQTLERWTRRMLGWSFAVTAALFFGYVLLLIATGWDWIGAVETGQTVWLVSLGGCAATGAVLGFGWLTVAVKWFGVLWDEHFPGAAHSSVARWLWLPILAASVFAVVCAVQFVMAFQPDPLLGIKLPLGGWHWVLWGALAAGAGWILLVVWVPAIAGMKWLPEWRALWMTVGAAWGLALVFSYTSMAHADREWDARIGELRERNFPLDNVDLERGYYRGHAPDLEWTAWVDRKQAFPGATYLTEFPVFDSAAFRRAVGAAPEEVRAIDAVVARAPFKYAIDFKVPFAWAILLPHLKYYRSAVRWYGARTLLALEDGNPAEAMRFHALAADVVRSNADEPFLIGALVAIDAEHLRLDMLARMLAAGRWSEPDRKKLEAGLTAMEMRLQQTLKNGFVTEFPLLAGMREWWTRYDGGDVGHRARNRSNPLRNPVLAPLYNLLSNDAMAALDLWLQIYRELDARNFMEIPSGGIAEKIAKSGFRPETFPGRLLWVFCIGGYVGAVDRLTSLRARCAMARIALEIDRFRARTGRIPENLAELKMSSLPSDPFTGGAFFYRRWENGYRLWGVGRNRIDNGRTPVRGTPIDDIFTVANPN